MKITSEGIFLGELPPITGEELSVTGLYRRGLLRQLWERQAAEIKVLPGAGQWAAVMVLEAAYEEGMEAEELARLHVDLAALCGLTTPQLTARHGLFALCLSLGEHYQGVGHPLSVWSYVEFEEGRQE